MLFWDVNTTKLVNGLIEWPVKWDIPGDFRKIKQPSIQVENPTSTLWVLHGADGFDE